MPPSSITRTMQAAYYRINRWLTVVGGILLSICMFYTVFDVGGRYLFNHPIPGTIEISQNVLVAAVFMAITYHEMSSGHIKVILLTTRMSAKAQLLSDIVVRLISAVVFFILAWQNLVRTLYLWSGHVRAEGYIGVLLWIPASFIFLGSTLFFFHSLASFLSKAISLTQSKRAHTNE